MATEKPMAILFAAEGPPVAFADISGESDGVGGGYIVTVLFGAVDEEVELW